MADNKSKFINPYNFVPLGKKCSRSEYKKGKLSGVIKYSLLNKTPLFIPDTDPENIKTEGDHKTYKFFTYDGEKPVIPGSEIRGMLRSYYEILTNSCLSAVDTDVTLAKRTSEVYKPGLIKKCEDNKYELYSATDCLLRTTKEDCLDVIEKPSIDDLKVKSYKQSKMLEGQRVYISFTSRGSRIKPLVSEVALSKTKNCRKEAYIIKGEAGPEMADKKKEKHCGHVFMLDNRKTDVIASIDIEKLQKAIDLYQNNEENRYEEYKKQLKRYIKGELDNEYFPVYYSEIKEQTKTIIMLSPASITREVFDTKIEKMIGDYTQCKDENCLCPSCKLFGMLYAKTAVTSRIRISDMEHKESKQGIYEDNLWTLKPMSTPKLQNLEFYMKKPAANAWFWTYDYYVDDNGRLHINNNPEINGRKFYWHHPSVNKSKVTTREKDDKNVTVMPIKTGNLFEGKIYFDNITEDELKSLTYLLNMGQSCEIDKRTHGYKLGHGKPFGLGSVAIRIDAVEVRIVENINGSIERKIVDKTKEYDGDSLIISEDMKKKVMKIADFNAFEANANITYPTMGEVKNAEKEEEGFVWFVNNHLAYKYDKKIQGKVKMNAPNQRIQMVYREYMEPMKAELVPVDRNMNKLIQNSSGKNSYNTNGGSKNTNSNFKRTSK